ncbi:MAG: protein kinase [bacterium]
MFIPFNCERCGTKLDVDSTSCGSLVECPRCRVSITVPHKGPEPGVTVGGFKILSLLAKGGMGEVFLARQISMDRDVALKILPRALTTDKEEVGRFLNEVRMAARLEHPNIVTAYEAGEDAGVYFLAMAYVRGETLESRLKKSGVMTEADALHIVRKVASALAYAWNRHHLIHRDVKPANIVMDEAGEPKLTDMGLSKSLREAGGMTLAGTVMGTPNYMSPEQADGSDKVDFRTDIYSLGATLYHMVTAQLPFSGKTLMETLRKQAVESLPDPRDVNISLSESCVLIIESMMARKPEHRHASWEALLREVDTVFAGGALARPRLPAGQSVLELADPVEVEVVEEPKPNAVAKAVAARGRAAPASPPPPRPAAVATQSRWPLVLGIAGALLIVVLGVGIALALKGKSEKSAPVVTPAPAVPQPAPALAPARPAQKPEQPPVQAVSNDQWKTVLSPEQIAASRPRPKPQPASATPPPPVASPAQPAGSPEPVNPPAVVPPVPAVDVQAELTAAADALLRKDRAAAQTALVRIAGQQHSDEDAAVRDGMERFLRMKEIILESLKADVGNEVTITFNKSGAERVQIIAVDGGKVKARSNFKGDGDTSAWIDRTFTCADLTPAEQIRRLGEGKGVDRNALLGLLALETRTPGRAADCFARATGPFGKLLAARYEAMVKPAAAGAGSDANDPEAAAEKAYDDILNSAGVTVRGNDEEELLLAIRKQKCGEIQVREIKAGLALFKSKFGATECAKRNRRALESLGFVRVNKPMHVDAAVLAEAVDRLQKANPVGTVNPVVSWNEDGLSLDFANQKNLMIISSLGGLPVARLDISGTQVRDISVVRGMPLRVFRGGQGPWMPGFDLRPLASMSLVEFRYAGTEVKGLEWMHGMPLTNISIHCGTFVPGDLRHLKGMPLSMLRIVAGNNGLVDIAAARGMPLVELELHSDSRCSLSDLSPLAGMKLTKLSLVNTEVIDLSPLKGMPLTQLDLSGTAIRDLRGLKGLPLTRLSIARTKINNLNGLAGIPLEYLDVRESKVTDFAALKDIPTLKDVSR